jgi:hypothetical protein
MEIPKSMLAETMVGPYNLVHVAFYTPSVPVKGPLDVVFQLSESEDDRRFIDIMDAAQQTLVRGIQRRPPGGGSGVTRRDAAQWLADIAGARYGCEVSDLDKWI